MRHKLDSTVPQALGPSIAESKDTILRPKVLAVDDDSRNLLALVEVLADVAEVVSASSGDEALRHLLKERFAVILMDVLMPGLDGYETAKLMRMREQSRDTPIIFLTAINKEAAHLTQGYDQGAVDYLFKPFDPTILRSKVSVFVSLYEKSREIERNAQREKELLEDKLRAQAERASVDQALQEAEQRQSLILRSLPLAIYTLDRDTSQVLFVGGDIRQLTGFSEADFEANTEFWWSRIHPEDYLDAFRVPQAPGGAREYRWCHRDGTYRFLLDQWTAIPGKAESFAGTVLDVTAQRSLQNTLTQAQKMDAVGKLTGGVAHDFNNLLASVLSGIALLEKRGELSESGRRILHMMRHAAEQGSQLISRMLTFSRRQNLQPSVVDVRELAVSLDGMLSPVLGGLVQLDWDIAEDLWPAFVDASQLELAVMNLVINARDAMPKGGLIKIKGQNRVEQAQTGELAAGEYVVVSVSDNGSGIPLELQSRVLEPFFTTKDAGKGTGLGLSSVFGFSKQSGGTLRLSSELARGTTVEIWLPRSFAALAGHQRAEPVEVSLPISGTETILLIDDSVELRHLTEMQLKDAGYTVVSAGGAVEALSLLEQSPSKFALIVTDYAMPVMSGLEVIRVARTMRANFPAIVISGYADQSEVFHRPADVPLISKPFHQSTLLIAIRQALGGPLLIGSG